MDVAAENAGSMVNVIPRRLVPSLSCVANAAAASKTSATTIALPHHGGIYCSIKLLAFSKQLNLTLPKQFFFF